jgi:hypothetical protein
MHWVHCKTAGFDVSAEFRERVPSFTSLFLPQLHSRTLTIHCSLYSLSFLQGSFDVCMSLVLCLTFISLHALSSIPRSQFIVGPKITEYTELHASVHMYLLLSWAPYISTEFSACLYVVPCKSPAFYVYPEFHARVLRSVYSLKSMQESNGICWLELHARVQR